MSALGYCDVFAYPDGRLGFVRDFDGGVSLSIDGALAWRLPTPEQLLCLRAGYLGAVVVIGQGNASGHALVSVDGNPVADFGPTFGTNPVAVGPDGVYVVRAGDRCDVLSIAGVFIRQERMAFGSQGLRDVTPDGEIRTGDAWFTRTVSGLPLVQPSQRGLVWVGQNGDAGPDRINAVVAGVYSTSLLGPGYEPHVVQLAADRYAICARPFAAPVMLPPIAPYVPEGGPMQPPTLKKPEVTVEQWTLQHLRDGEVLQVFDRENPDLGYRTLVWIEHGGLKVKITNAVGSGQTGAFRPVVPS